MTTEREEWGQRALLAAGRSFDMGMEGGDNASYHFSNFSKLLDIAMKVLGWEQESEKRTLTPPNLMEQLKRIEDRLAGKKVKSTLKPRGKPFTRDDPRIQRKTTDPEQLGSEQPDDLPFSDPPDVS